MTLVTDAVEPAARPGPMQTALGLIANPVGTFQAASVLLRGAPSLAGWLAGWAMTEFPLRVLTGHALSSVNAAPVNRFTAGLAAQRADSVLQEALTETHGSDYTEQVSHPITDPTIRRHSVAGVWRAAQRSRYATVTRNLAYGPGGRDHLLDIWRRPDVTPALRSRCYCRCPAGHGRSARNAARPSRC